MFSPKLILFAVAAITLQLTPVWNKSPILCNFDKCTKPMEIHNPPLPDVNINTATQRALVRKVKGPLIIMYHRTRKYNSTCEFAFTHQDSRDCAFSTTIIDHSIEDLQRIKDRGEYPIGRSCLAPDDCSYEECRETQLTKLGKGNKEFIKYGAYHKNRWSSTCIIDWEVHTYTVSSHSILKHHRGNSVLVISDKEGTVHEINPIENNVIMMKDGYSMYVERVEISETQINVRCLSRDDRGLCITQDANGIIPKGTVFQMTSTLHGTTDNAEMVLDNPITMKPTDVYGETDLGSSSTIGDVIKVMQLAIFDQLQSQFNSLLLAREVGEIRSLLINIIRSVSMIHPPLIGFLNNQQSYTRWVTKNEFVQCPCIDFQDTTGLCKGKMIFQEGLWKIKKEEDTCYPPIISNSSIPNFWSPFTAQNLSLEMVNIPELLRSINDQIMAEQDNSMFTHVDGTYSGGSNFFETLFNQIKDLVCGNKRSV